MKPGSDPREHGARPVRRRSGARRRARARPARRRRSRRLRGRAARCTRASSRCRTSCSRRTSAAPIAARAKRWPTSPSTTCSRCSRGPSPSLDATYELCASTRDDAPRRLAFILTADARPAPCQPDDTRAPAPTSRANADANFVTTQTPAIPRSQSAPKSRPTRQATRRGGASATSAVGDRASSRRSSSRPPTRGTTSSRIRIRNDQTWLSLGRRAIRWARSPRR